MHFHACHSCAPLCPPMSAAPCAGHAVLCLRSGPMHSHACLPFPGTAVLSCSSLPVPSQS
eukprot:256566-Chlamydomonas_euryale.AAC.1